MWHKRNWIVPIKSDLLKGSSSLFWIIIWSSSSSSSSNVKNWVSERLWVQCSPLILNQLGWAKAAHVKKNVNALKNAAILLSSLSWRNGNDVNLKPVKDILLLKNHRKLMYSQIRTVVKLSMLYHGLVKWIIYKYFNGIFKYESIILERILHQIIDNISDRIYNSY